MAINVSANCKDTPPGRWPWMESRNLLNVNRYAGTKKNSLDINAAFAC